MPSLTKVWDLLGHLAHSAVLLPLSLPIQVSTYSSLHSVSAERARVRGAQGGINSHESTRGGGGWRGGHGEHCK